MNPETLHEAFRQQARSLAGIDTAVYETHDLDPCEPIIGEGNPLAKVAIFGRDPGREEVRWRQPFIGAGGQKVRAALYRVLYDTDLPDFEASMDVGRFAFWANTVPYKPLGNKAWSQKVKRSFQPLMAAVLLGSWQGADILTLGREAFLWFGLTLPRSERQALEAFWRRPDRFESSFSVRLAAEGCKPRTFHLHPLPHPSPLNATWYKQFSGLLVQRLEALNFTLESWCIETPLSQCPLE